MLIESRPCGVDDDGVMLMFWVNDSKKTRPSPLPFLVTVPTSFVRRESVPERVIDLISVAELRAPGLPEASSCLTTWIVPGPVSLRVQWSPAVSVPDTEAASSCRASRPSAEGRRARDRMG